MAISRLRQPTFYNLSVARAAAYAESGGTIVESGGYRIHTIEGNTTFVLSSPGSIEYLLVAGGGGGSPSTGNNYATAGGGAGGYISGFLTLNNIGDYVVTVGQGGNYGSNGSNTTFNSFTAIGGGAGTGSTGNSGGSGAGG